VTVALSERAPRRRRTWVVVALCASVPLICIALWLLAHRIHEPPPPLWTLGDLPRVPASSDNGYILLDAPTTPRLSWLVSQDEEGLDFFCGAPGSEAGSADPNWGEVLSRRQLIVDVVADTDFIARQRVGLDASQRPRFAEDNDPVLDADWHGMHVVRWHKGLELTLLLRALEGDFPGALTGATDLFRAALDLVRTARSFVGHLVAIVVVARSIELLHRIDMAIDATEGAGDNPALQPTLTRLGSLLQTLDEATLDMRHAMIFEYLHSRAAIDAIARDPEIASLPPWGSLVFDRQDTARRIDNNFQRIVEFARDPSVTPEPEFRTGTERPMWWLFNPGGQQALEVFTSGVSYAARIRTFEEQEASLKLRARELASRLQLE